MKEIINISFASSKDDYEFKTRFLDQDFYIRRLGADGDPEKAVQLLLRWAKTTSAVGLDFVKFPYSTGSGQKMEVEVNKLMRLANHMQIPVTTGEALRSVSHEWCLRHIQFQNGNNYFFNSKVFFFSGLIHHALAKVMSEYTANLIFADPVMESGIPKFLNSIRDLEFYMKEVHGIIEWISPKRLSSMTIPLRSVNNHLIRKAIQKSNIIVVPHYDFYNYIGKYSIDELCGKTIITSTVYDDRIKFLKERGVNVIIDSTPKMLENVVGHSVLEALIIVALKKPCKDITNEDYLEIISDQRMDPRIIYPSGDKERVNRFAYIIHPLSQESFKQFEPIDVLSKYTPPVFMSAVEKIMAYTPPFIYSKITGVKSIKGVKAEGWIIVLGITPEEMLSHNPDFISKRLLQAAKMAKKLGAQIIGFGPLTKSVKEAGLTLSKFSDIPVTTGNTYIASSALWATADAVRRMGLIPFEKNKKLKAKTMVIGATGAVGSVCSRLLAKAFEEVYLVGRNIAKLLALQNSILEETPDVKIHLSIRADKYIQDMDVIVAGSSVAKYFVDIMKLKPGCVFTDITRPLIFSSQDVEKRRDVLFVKSGEIFLPGNVEMRDINLPPKVVYAGLAETIVLALEGRFEAYSIGSDIEWTKVREIYKTSLSHGMKLDAISGVNGVFTDEDIQKVKQLALIARSKTI